MKTGRIFQAAFLVLLGAHLGCAQENYSTHWMHYEDLSLTTTSVTSQAVVKFPMLVRLDTTNFKSGFSQALPGGRDIRFMKMGSGVHLPYQIEGWDTTRKAAAIWVLVDTINSGSNNAFVRMYWGNGAAADSSNGKAVFDTANGFQAVFHMNKGDTTSELDATANAYVASEYNQPADAAGAIGRARFFNGTTQRFQIGNSASSSLNFQLTDGYTLSAWLYPDSISKVANDGNKIIDKGDNQYILGDYASAIPKYWEIMTRGNGAFNQCTGDPEDTSEAGLKILNGIVSDTAKLGGWHHLVGTYQGGAVNSAIAESLYYDGMLMAVWVGTNTSNGGRVLTFNVNLGVQAAGTAPLGTNFSRYWDGLLDEVRFSNRSRSSDWVKLEYANERPATQGLLYFGPPVTVGLHGAPQEVPAERLLSVNAFGNGLLFQVREAASAEANIALFDMWGRNVWSRTVDLRNGNPIVWNGVSNQGRRAVAGIYVTRLTLLDDQNQAIQILEKKVAFMP